MIINYFKKLYCFFFLFVFISLEAAHSPIIKQEFIFTNAPFAFSHASTITETHSGKLLCAWFAGSEHGAKDVEIWLSTSTEAGWSSPKQVATENGVPCWNPVLFTLPSNEILLFYKAGYHPEEWSGMLKRSHDEGKAWREAESLPAGINGPTKNKPLLLKDGTLLCGSSTESWRRWGCWVDITSDNGYHWMKSTPINLEKQLFGIIEPALFFTKEGAIKMLTRSYQGGHICSATSEDQGRTWSSASPISLPNPNSAIDAVNLQDGRIILVYNHSKKERTPLNVAVSKDDGKSWETKVTLEDSEGEYSYPSVIQSKDGRIHITYSWNRTKIKHVVIDPKLL